MVYAKDEHLTPDERRDHRLDDLDRRMHLFEEGQCLAWTYTASAQGAELERRYGLLFEAVENLTSIVGAFDDPDDVAARQLDALNKAVATVDEIFESVVEEVGALGSILSTLTASCGLPAWQDGESYLTWSRRVAEAASPKRDTVSPPSEPTP